MPSPDFVGRASELRILDEVVRSGGAVVVSGPAGIGKSRLLLEGTRSALDLGMTIVTATGVQSEAPTTKRLVDRGQPRSSPRSRSSPRALEQTGFCEVHHVPLAVRISCASMTTGESRPSVKVS